VSTTTAWKCIAVHEFISNSNWQGLLPQVSTKSSSQLNQVKNYLASWQCLTTYKFFTLNNWDGQTNLFHIEDEVDKNNSAIAEGVAKPFADITQGITFSLTLPSNQFWQCFSWSSQSKLTEQSPADNVEYSQISESFSTKTEDEFTLKDLSQLF
jgi:hypothetical protein